MNRMMFPFVLCLCFGTSNAFGDEENHGPSDTTAAAASRVARLEEKAVLASLSKLVNLECHDMPIREALEQLSKLIDREILINVEKLSDEGISIDQTVVTHDLGEITAWQSLHFLLQPLQLTWVANDGILEVTTLTHADEIRVTRVYDVRSLCELLDPLTRDLPLRQRRAVQQHSTSMGGGGGSGYFSVPASTISSGIFNQFGGQGAGTAEGGINGERVSGGIPVGLKPIEEFLASFVIHCSSLKWELIDGEGGTVEVGQGRLVVSQSYRGQFEIAGILQALQQLVQANIPAQSITARRIGYPHKDDAAIFETLGRLTTIEIPEGELGQALEWIAREAGIRLWIDISALSEEGININLQINQRRRMQKLPLGICLKKLLEPYQLTGVVEEGILVITTNTQAEEMLTTRFYDVSQISMIGMPALANGNRYSRMLHALQSMTHGKWYHRDGDGGIAVFVSSKHLAIRQTQKVDTEISLLFDDLTTNAPDAPEAPSLENRVYAAPDVETARDLVQILPRTLEQKWNQKGSINQAGKLLLVSQTAQTHELIAEIMSELTKAQHQINSVAPVPGVKSPLTEPPNSSTPSKTESKSGG